MKNWLKKSVLALCSASLAYGVFLPFYGRSYFFFGEPEFPTED